MEFKPIFDTTKPDLGAVLGPLEHKILRLLWAAERRLALRPITTRLALDFEEKAETTVLFTLNRMTRKGLLKRMGSRRDYTWEPMMDEETFRAAVTWRVMRDLHNLVGDETFETIAGHVRNQQ